MTDDSRADGPEAAPNEAPNTDDWRVVEVVPEGADVTSLVMQGPGRKPHRPGQFGTIRVLTDDGWSEAHPFTISCAPEADAVRMTIKRAGEFTERIASLKPGTPVQFSGPYGVFLGDVEQQGRIAMVAGGVGITPFLSVLRHFRAEKADNAVVLIWANKTWADAFAAEELRDMTRDLDLTVVHVLSREVELPAEAEPTDRSGRGRVRFELGHVDRGLIQKHVLQAGWDATAKFYLCGPPAMQEFVLGEMAACGIDPAGVDKEAFAYRGK